MWVASWCLRALWCVAYLVVFVALALFLRAMYELSTHESQRSGDRDYRM